MFALFFCLVQFRTTDFTLIVASLHADRSGYVDLSTQLICLFFIFAAVAKSAQLGLHTWLPDAMEGPTPVSALIHAATMVTAGVFLMLRVAPILCMYEAPSLFLLYLGSMTAFFAGTVAVAQYDLKRVVAYSTCSQLGFMMAAAGAGVYDTCLFHLVNHAFFKALLFLTAGMIIHSLNNEQDMRSFGGLIKILPFCYVLMFMCNLGLTGFPFVSGYYSKDNLLEMVLLANPICWFLLITTSFLTAFYSVRTVYLVFAETPRFSPASVSHLSEGPYLLLIPTLMLAGLTLVHGFVVKDMYTGLGSTLYPIIPYSPYPPEYALTAIEKLLPFVITLVAGAIWFFYYRFNFKIYKLFRFLNKRWFFDYLDTYVFRLSFIRLYKLFASVERGHNDIPSVVSCTLRVLNFRTLSKGYIAVFLAIFLILLSVLVLYLAFNTPIILIPYAYRVSEKHHRNSR